MEWDDRRAEMGHGGPGASRDRDGHAVRRWRHPIGKAAAAEHTIGHSANDRRDHRREGYLTDHLWHDWPDGGCSRGPDTADPDAHLAERFVDNKRFGDFTVEPEYVPASQPEKLLVGRR